MRLCYEILNSTLKHWHQVDSKCHCCASEVYENDSAANTSFDTQNIRYALKKEKEFRLFNIKNIYFNI